MTFHFIIEELTATTLRVKTYNGQSYSFTTDNSSSGVRSLTQTRSADEFTYNLSGQKVEKGTADGIYIQNGQKMVVKTVSKVLILGEWIQLSHQLRDPSRPQRASLLPCPL